MLAGAQQRDRPALAARQHAVRERRAAARRAELRTCRCPTGRRRPSAARPPAARPSRPQAARGRRRTAASSTSNEARPLNGQATTPSCRRAASSRSHAAWSSTTPPARSSSAARRPARSAARPARAERRAASVARPLASRRGGPAAARRRSPRRSSSTGGSASSPGRRAAAHRRARPRRREARASASPRHWRPRRAPIGTTSTGRARQLDAQRVQRCVHGLSGASRRRRGRSSVGRSAAPGARQHRLDRRRRAGAGGVEHRRAVAVQLRRELGRQPRLADARARPRRATSRPAPPWASPPVLAQRLEIGLAAQERQCRRRAPGGARWGLRRGEPRGRGPGSGSPRAGRAGPGPARPRSPRRARGAQSPLASSASACRPRAIEREHPLRLQSLPQRLLGGEPPRAHRGPHDGGRCPGRRRWPARTRRSRSSSRRRIAVIANGSSATSPSGVPAPQPQRLPRHAARDAAARSARTSSLAVAEAQLVAAAACDDLRAVAARRERLAQLRDVDLDHLVGRWPAGRSPHRPSTRRSGRDRLAEVQREQGEERARLAGADGHSACHRH